MIQRPPVLEELYHFPVRGGRCQLLTESYVPFTWDGYPGTVHICLPITAHVVYQVDVLLGRIKFLYAVWGVNI